MSENKSLMDYYWDEITKEGNPPPIDLFIAWLNACFQLELALYARELSMAKTEEQVKLIHKNHTGEFSFVWKIEKALADSYKKEKNKN